MIHIQEDGKDQCMYELHFNAMFLSLQIGFSFTNAVDVCAHLARISVFHPSSLMIALRYLNCFTVSSYFPLAIMRDLILLQHCTAFCHYLVFFCANFHSTSG